MPEKITFGRPSTATYISALPGSKLKELRVKGRNASDTRKRQVYVKTAVKLYEVKKDGKKTGINVVGFNHQKIPLRNGELVNKNRKVLLPTKNSRNWVVREGGKQINNTRTTLPKARRTARRILS